MIRMILEKNEQTINEGERKRVRNERFVYDNRDEIDMIIINVGVRVGEETKRDI